MVGREVRSVYEVDGYEVAFVPWRSEFLEEDFVAVYVTKDGREVMHSGMTKLEPSDKTAQDVVDAMLALREAMRDGN